MCPPSFLQKLLSSNRDEETVCLVPTLHSSLLMVAASPETAVMSSMGSIASVFCSAGSQPTSLYLPRPAACLTT